MVLSWLSMPLICWLMPLVSGVSAGVAAGAAVFVFAGALVLDPMGSRAGVSGERCGAASGDRHDGEAAQDAVPERREMGHLVSPWCVRGMRIHPTRAPDAGP